ncbi:MAG: hypothetical protein IK121_05260, partial [Lachnospiraceae bacterium]|nr:hypothetical protein [Lachnospiraceae bacterium]
SINKDLYEDYNGVTKNMELALPAGQKEPEMHREVRNAIKAAENTQQEKEQQQAEYYQNHKEEEKNEETAQKESSKKDMSFKEFEQKGPKKAPKCRQIIDAQKEADEAAKAGLKPSFFANMARVVFYAALNTVIFIKNMAGKLLKGVTPTPYFSIHSMNQEAMQDIIKAYDRNVKEFHEQVDMTLGKEIPMDKKLQELAKTVNAYNRDVTFSYMGLQFTIRPSGEEKFFSHGYSIVVKQVASDGEKVLDVINMNKMTTDDKKAVEARLSFIKKYMPEEIRSNETEEKKEEQKKEPLNASAKEIVNALNECKNKDQYGYEHAMLYKTGSYVISVQPDRIKGVSGLIYQMKEGQMLSTSILKIDGMEDLKQRLDVLTKENKLIPIAKDELNQDTLTSHFIAMQNGLEDRMTFYSKDNDAMQMRTVKGQDKAYVAISFMDGKGGRDIDILATNENATQIDGLFEKISNTKLCLTEDPQVESLFDDKEDFFYKEIEEYEKENEPIREQNEESIDIPEEEQEQYEEKPDAGDRFEDLGLNDDDIEID